MTEKDYNPNQKEKKAMAEQLKTEKAGGVMTPDIKKIDNEREKEEAGEQKVEEKP